HIAHALSFPTRRSSDLAERDFFFAVPCTLTVNTNGNGSAVGPKATVPTYIGRGYKFVAKPMPGNIFDYWSDDATGQVLGSNAVRSEEHTSELQSRRDLV